MAYNNLTTEQRFILEEKGTEMPGSGKWLHNKATGKYTCAKCGKVLFESITKFDSGTGWPSFSDAKNVELKKDMSHGMLRTEALCKNCGGHLGHVFDDGPKPTKKRYCINSCALDFSREEINDACRK